MNRQLVTLLGTKYEPIFCRRCKNLLHKCDCLNPCRNGRHNEWCNCISLSHLPIDESILKDLFDIPPIPIYMFPCPNDCTSYGYGKEGLKNYGVFRYANGQWLPNDGKPDLAFIGYLPYNMGKGGAPIFYGVELPRALSDEHWHHPNIIAYNSASWKCSEINSCASGITIDINKCKVKYINS